MRTFLVVLLFALASCNFSSNLKQIAQCLIESQKLREYLPKLVKAIKAGDYQTLLKEGLSAYQEIKTEVKECYDSEPILRVDDCKHKIVYAICLNGCDNILAYKICSQSCYDLYCK